MSADDQAPVVVRLDDETIEQLAHRVAHVLRTADPETLASRRPERGDAGRMLSAAQVAERWQIDREWVYAHADELGAMRLGTGPRPRLRFDPDRVHQRLQRTTTPAEPAPQGRGRRRSPSIPGDPGELLPFRADPELSSNRPPRRSTKRHQRAADHGSQGLRSTR